jgi:hypothetical protein
VDARTNEQLRTRLTSFLQACRAHHLIKDAGGHVTEGERAEIRAAYCAALERLSSFLTDTSSTFVGISDNDNYDQRNTKHYPAEES